MWLSVDVRSNLAKIFRSLLDLAGFGQGQVLRDKLERIKDKNTVSVFRWERKAFSVIRERERGRAYPNHTGNGF